MGTEHVISNYIKDNNLRFSFGKAKILPFNTRGRVTYKNGFNGIVGEVARIIENYELKDVSLSNEISILITNRKIDISSEFERDFINIVEEFNPQNLNCIHKNVSLFKFNPLSSSKAILNVDKLTKPQMEENRKEADIAEFIYFAVLNENASLKHFFNESREKDVLTKLYEMIFGNVSDALIRENDYMKMCFLFDNVIADDLDFIIRNEEFFSNNFDKFIAFYFFQYCLQTIFLMDSLTYNTQSITPIYWLIDSEKASPNRKAVSEGWKILRTNVGKRMWVNNIVLDILCLLEQKEISDLNEFYNLNRIEEITKIVFEFSAIIQPNKQIPNFQNTKEAVAYLYKLLSSYYDSEGTKQGTESRYTLWLEELGKKYFLKQRRQYSYILNLTEDFLVFIISIVVKEERIKLSHLFQEFEKRAIFLDNKSKKEVISILNKQGLLEKKSDSGDAQYVKRIIR